MDKVDREKLVAKIIEEFIAWADTSIDKFENDFIEEHQIKSISDLVKYNSTTKGRLLMKYKYMLEDVMYMTIEGVMGRDISPYYEYQLGEDCELIDVTVNFYTDLLLYKFIENEN